MKEISAQELAELDGLYGRRDAGGGAPGWRFLVEELRKVRRAIEAGDVVHIADGTKLESVLQFHEWAYRRYKLLEEGIDSWIGDDES